MSLDTSGPRHRRHKGKYLGSLRVRKYGMVDLYLTLPTPVGDGELVVRYADGETDYLQLGINQYVAEWNRAPEMFHEVYLTACEQGAYNDTVH